MLLYFFKEPHKSKLIKNAKFCPNFSKNLISLIEDDMLRNEMGRAGYNHVSELFSYKRLVRDVGELYENLLNEKNI